MRNLFLVFFSLVAITPVFSQKEKCLTAAMYQEAIQRDSAFLVKRARIQKHIDEFTSKRITFDKTSGTPRIIPVVFHVIHNGGDENISKAQIEDQIKILNKDYRRLNADASNTPSAFKGVAVDCNVEFRLAQKDEKGNCTEGIVRVLSPLTTNARDNVKALSYWNSSKYLNIWVVKSIRSSSGSGTVLGYAQLPGGDPSIDGVVLRSDVIGSIGTAKFSYGQTEAGRSATHEIGHWLDLYHTWGDDDDACTGTDYVNDTPNQAGPSEKCSSFPKTDNCTSGNGIMFMNYMDYTDGICMNMFTAGQKARIDATLSGSRASLITAENLIATGTDGTLAVQCAPIPLFSYDNAMICPGSAVGFTDLSYNGTVTKWTWSFPGGTPSSSTAKNPVIQYNTPGKFDVTLTVENAAGKNTVTQSAIIFVTSPLANYTVPYADSFEAASFPGEWKVVNEDNGNTWARTLSYTTSREGRLSIENFEANVVGLKDILVSPSIDLTKITKPLLSFRVAYAQVNAASKDKLTVSVSKDCGQTWATRFSKSGATLATVPVNDTYFIPNPSQWRKEVIDLSPALISGPKDNVRFKIEFENGGGNNIFIDNINLASIYSVNTITESLDLSFFPNPSHKDVYFGFNLYNETLIKVEIFDALGRAFSSFMDQTLPPGEHVYNINTLDKPGIYYVRIYVGEGVYVKKLVIY